MIRGIIDSGSNWQEYVCLARVRADPLLTYLRLFLCRTSVSRRYSNAVRPQRFQESRPPPPSYVCHRCNGVGHYINNCPTNGDPNYDFHKVKKATGIPRSFLKPVEVRGVPAQ